MLTLDVSALDTYHGEIIRLSAIECHTRNSLIDTCSMLASFCRWQRPILKQGTQSSLKAWNVVFCTLFPLAKVNEKTLELNDKMVVTAVFLGVIVAGLSILDIYLLKQCFGQQPQDEEDGEAPTFPVTVPYYVFAR